MSVEKEGQSSEFWPVPKEIKTRVDVFVNTSAFDQRLEMLVQEHDQNFPGVRDAILRIGWDVFAAEDGVTYALRDKAGMNEPINFFDERFSYDKEAVVTDEDGSTRQPKTYVWYGGNLREYCLTRANDFRMDMEEVAARQMQIGMYVLEEIREGNKWLVRSDFHGTKHADDSVPSPKADVKRRMKEFRWKPNQKLLPPPRREDANR